MAKYAIAGAQNTLTTTYKSAISGVSSSTVRRQKIFDLLIGAGGTPADNILQWDISRVTAAGTNTAVTPVPLDPADAAALTTAGQNHTVEPTVTASTSLFNEYVNQRTAYRWMAVPGAELVFPATSAAGWTFRALSPGYTNSAGGTVYIEEQ
jgi:hypothetical protein